MSVAPGAEPGLSLFMKTMTVSEAEAGFARLLGWVASGEEVAIKFGDQVTRQAVIEGTPSAVAALPEAKPAKAAKPRPAASPQGDLF